MLFRKLMTFSPRMMEMIKEIKELKGYHADSAVIQQGVVELHAKSFPAYVKPVREPRTAEEKVREKFAIKEAEKLVVTEEQAKICEKLGGQVLDGGAEVGMMCYYKNYNFKNVYPQEVPLSQLSEDMIKNQYHPSRQRVEALLSKDKPKKSKS